MPTPTKYFRDIWYQDPGISVVLANGAVLALAHGPVTNEKILINVVKDANVDGKTDISLDFDLVDAGNFSYDNTKIEFNANGKVALKLTTGPLVRINPIMTGVSTPSGTASATDWSGANFPWRAMDNDPATRWHENTVDPVIGNPASWQTLMFDFGPGVNAYITGYTLNCGDDPFRNYMPTIWRTYASIDGVTWTAMDTADQTKTWLVANETVNKTVSAPGFYRYFKIICKQTPTNYCSIAEMTIVGSLTAFYPTGTFLVSTTDANHFPLEFVRAIAAPTATQATPTNTSLRYIASFDNRVTWYRWDIVTSAWVLIDPLNIGTEGNTLAEFQLGFAAGLVAFPSVGTYIDYAWGLSSTNASATPVLDQFSTNYTENARYDPCTVGPYGSSTEIGVSRTDSTHTNIKNQSGGPLTVIATAMVP